MSKLTDKQYKILGRYMSTYDFVACNQLEKEAEKVLGKNWEAEDDACQVQDILDTMNPDGFIVEHISNCRTDNDIQVREMDNFSSTALFEWFNNFVDYVQNKNNNLYNEACKYADEREEGCI
jgi:pyridoxal/pyridoxine/pyridoxamine kinase